MTPRLIKNLVNLVGLLLFSIYILMTIMFISNNAPYCWNVGNIVLWQTTSFLPAIFIYLALSTLMNFLTEKFLEKSKGTKSYLKILGISILTIAFAILWAFLDLYGHCENN